MREIDEVIVHCSYTTVDMDIGVAEIDKWHRQRGFDGCGYHFVIRRDGDEEVGRDIGKAGAHTIGRNAHSIGVCLVGGMGDDGKPDCNFTIEQYQTLKRRLAMAPWLPVRGHRDYSSKPCPCFDAAAL